MMSHKQQMSKINDKAEHEHFVKILKKAPQDKKKDVVYVQ